MAGLREKITKKEVTINCAIVVLLIGNNQIPWGPNLSPRAQMKKTDTGHLHHIWEED